MNSEDPCTQCREALPGYVAGTLAPATRQMVASHLVTCDACQREYAQWRALAELAHQADARTPPDNAQHSTATWAAIQSRILAESPFTMTIGALSMDFDQHDASQERVPSPFASPPVTGRSLTRRRVPFVAATAALLLVAFAAALFALHPRLGSTTSGSTPPGSDKHPSLTATPTPATTGVPVGGLQDAGYSASDILSPTDAWAIGNGTEKAGSVYASTIKHFDGHQWQDEAIFANSSLHGISMDSADDGWAVGEYTGDTGGTRMPLLVHYTRQGGWITQKLTMPDAVLEQVQMLGLDDGWATGGDVANGPIVLHYQHGVWTPTPFAPTAIAAATASYAPLSAVPPGVSQILIQQAQFLSDTEGWAWGQDHTDNVLWHYHNGQWQTSLRYPSASTANFFGLGINSATDVWVLGSAGLGAAFSAKNTTFASEQPRSSGGGTPVLLHYDGHAWAIMPADISAGGPFLAGAIWLASYGSVNQRQRVLGLLLNQGGHWSVTTFAQPVTHVLSATNAPDGSTLVVAALGEESGPQTLQLLRYVNGTWSS